MSNHHHDLQSLIPRLWLPCPAATYFAKTQRTSANALLTETFDVLWGIPMFFNPSLGGSEKIK